MTRALVRSLSRALRPGLPDVMGVAVSGGGDSVALLHLLHEMAQEAGKQLRVVTVNHHLRPEAIEEVHFVAGLCANLGVSHDVLDWDGWDGRGNLQAAARNARYQLISQWATRNKICTIALGHTADDQAETVLMRLARRSGVDGLAGMASRHSAYGIEWCRPMLHLSRSALRDYLRDIDVRWIDDPSNDDETFDRIKARRVLTALAPLGIDVEGLSVVAENMAHARKALSWQSFLAAKEIATIQSGAIVLTASKLRLQPEEIRRRLLVRAVMSIARRDYAPRREAVETLLDELNTGGGATLDGCRSLHWKGHIWVFREYAAAARQQSPLGELWDGRWHLSCDTPPDDQAGLEIRALGVDGLQQVEDWRAAGRPRELLLSSPAVWRGDALVSAPLAQPRSDWQAWCDGDDDMFFAGLLSH